MQNTKKYYRQNNHNSSNQNIKRSTDDPKYFNIENPFHKNLVKEDVKLVAKTFKYTAIIEFSTFEEAKDEAEKCSNFFEVKVLNSTMHMTVETTDPKGEATKSWLVAKYPKQKTDLHHKKTFKNF